jgi:hypothetical protein
MRAQTFHEWWRILAHAPSTLGGWARTGPGPEWPHNKQNNNKARRITAMESPTRPQLAHRIHLGLMRELGQGIDVKQMLHSALYARDVLLVCQAYPDTELPQLAEHFRQATADRIVHRASSAEPGFGHAKPPLPSAAFDRFADSLPPTGTARAPARRWLTPSTWFAR